MAFSVLVFTILSAPRLLIDHLLRLKWQDPKILWG